MSAGTAPVRGEEKHVCQAFLMHCFERQNKPLWTSISFLMLRLIASCELSKTPFSSDKVLLANQQQY